MHTACTASLLKKPQKTRLALVVCAILALSGGRLFAQTSSAICIGANDPTCGPHDWRITADPGSGNQYAVRRNADGTTDVVGRNTRTGAEWDQHINPALNLQTGHDKEGRPWSATVDSASVKKGLAGERPQAPLSIEEFRELNRPTDEERAMWGVLSRMRPGSLADAAKAATAQRQCTARAQNATQLTACMK